MISTQREAQSLTLSLWRRLTWLPIPLLLVTMALFWTTDQRTAYDFPHLLMAVDFLCRTLACLLVVCLAGWSFLSRGAPGLLLLGCGVAIWGTSGFVTTSTLTLSDANLGVTISNLGIWMAALCHLTGVLLSLRSARVVGTRGLWLGAGYTLALFFVGLITLLTFAQRLPVFFVEGQGGLPVRHIVLGAALAMFVLTAVLLWEGNRPSLSPLTYWYMLALLLIATGIAGMMLQSSRNSLLNWACRGAQYLGGVYMFVAAIAAVRESGAREITLVRTLDEARYRYGVAIALVLAAAGLRLTFLQALGTQASFSMFYPAVIFSALYGGMRAGLVATVLSTIIADYFWIEPVEQFVLKTPSDCLELAVLLVGCTIISWFASAMRRAQTRAVQAEAEAKAAVERAKAADALRESEEKLKRLVADLERSNHDLEQFAYISSHDLQEPLRQVAAFVEMLDRHYSSLFDERAKEFMGFITEGTTRMSVLIKDLLAYSRIGRTDKSTQAVDVAAIAQEALQILRLRLEETNAEVTLGDLPVIDGNAVMLGQLFQNLIGNALKFRGEESPRIHIDCRREEKEWVFWVQDNGIGFAPENAEKIFEVFKRLHNRERYEGTGIGLSICKRVIELHGGRIWAESEPGKGTAFYFTIPVGK